MVREQDVTNVDESYQEIKERLSRLEAQLKRVDEMHAIVSIGDLEYYVNTDEILPSSFVRKLFAWERQSGVFYMKNFIDKLYDEDRTPFKLWLDAQLEGDTSTSGIFRVNKHQDCIYIHMRSLKHVNTDGQEYIHITIQDITQTYLIKKTRDEEILRSKIGARAAKMAFFKYDVGTGVQTVDDYWYEMAGLSVKYKNVHPYYKENIHPEDREKVIRYFEFSGEGKEENCEFRLYNLKNDKYIWIRMTGVIVEKLDAIGHYIMLGVYQNIDLEKQNQEENSQLANMLDIGMKNGRVDIWDYDMKSDLITLRCNNKETYGLDKNIVLLQINRMKRNIYHEDLHYFESSVRSVWISKEPSFNMSFRYINPVNLSMHWLKVVGRVTDYDELGRASRCIGICQDVTERYQDEEKVRKNEEKLRQASNIAHLGSWEYAEETQMIELLEGVHEILGISGYHEHYLISKRDFIEYAIESDRNKLEAIFDATHSWLQFDEHFFANINGLSKKLHIIATYKYDKEGKLVNIIGTIQDITEINSLEQALRQAEKMTAIGQLAGGIAHDFNNILMATSGYTELIMLKSNQDEVKAYCKKVMESINRSTDLTRKLLAFSRKDSLIKKPIHLHQCIENALMIINRTIDKNIDINIRNNAEEDVIFADASEIQNVFMNLCLNARDAMPNGGRLTIRTEIDRIAYENHVINGLELTEGRYIKVSVTDSGCGIAERNIKKVFDPFFTTKEVGKGTGLGLSASFGTIMSHQGAIDVESQVGLRTTFHVYFPLYTYGKDH